VAVFEQIRRRMLYEEVGDQIREAIIDGRLAPGEPLPPERELARDLGVSRASVREALRALVAQGVISESGRGPARTLIAGDLSAPLRETISQLLRLGRVEFGELVEVRCILEAAALERASAHPHHPRLDEAEEALATMRQPEVSVDDYEAADIAFHLALAAATDNEALYLGIMAIREAASRHILADLHARPNPTITQENLTEQHAEMLAAVRAGDPERAAAALREHVRWFYDVVQAGQGSDTAPTDQRRPSARATGAERVTTKPRRAGRAARARGSSS
jgi:GntR family transcriptional regulator, transcriptional repressor for pyruvate dehydrogenase complex